MNRQMTLILGAVILVVALVAAVTYSGRGTTTPTESAPAAVPAAPTTAPR